MMRKKKVKQIVLCVVLPLAIAGALLCGTYCMEQMLMQELQAAEADLELTKEEQSAMEQELLTQNGLMEEQQQKLEDIEAQIALYEAGEQAADPDAFLKQKMLDCYVENQELVIAAQSEVLESMGVDTSYLISYEEIDAQGEMIDQIQSQIVDGLVTELDAGVVGDIVGATVDETITALRDEVSAESLYQGITQGLETGITNTIQSTIQDKIGETIGFDIFGAASLMEQLSSYEEELPQYLASEISEEIQRDADQITSLIGQETVTVNDLQELQILYYDLGVLSEELYAQTDGGVDIQPDNWREHDEVLREINAQYQINKKIIEMCNERLGADANEE